MKSPTHCRNGHERTPQNAYRNAKGIVICRVCVRLKAAEQYDRDYRATPKPELEPTR